LTEAGFSIGLSRHAVNKVCLGINQTAGGYKWVYENPENNHYHEVDLTNAHKINAHGSHYITLSSANGKQNKYVHNLVATYFIDNLNNYKNVRHIDNDKNNNNVANLEWY